MFNLDFFLRSSLMGTTLRAAPSKSHAFSTNYHACIAMPTWHRCAPPILFWHWPLFNLFPSSCIHDFLRRFSLTPITCAVPNNLYAISTNYHIYIAMPTWYTVNSGQTGFPGDNVEWPFWTERRFIQVRPRGVGTDASEFNCITSWLLRASIISIIFTCFLEIE